MTADAKHRRVFLTGATGAMGSAAADALMAAGHEVIGVARSDEAAAGLLARGVRPARVDLFDAAAVREAMRGADAVAHFATKVPQGTDVAKPGAWRTNDRLRREGTRILLEAAREHGVRRFIFESIALAYPDGGEGWIDEGTALTALGPFMRTAIEAEAMLEGFGAEGGEPVSLRYSRLYGPGRASQRFLELVEKRQWPIVGAGKNFVSSIHVEDVGTSVVAALEAPPGVYNVSDEEPVRQSEYVRLVVEQLGAPKPRRVPEAVARVLLRSVADVATVSHRVSNRRFREATGWAPRYASVREGWPQVVRAERSGRAAAAS